MLSDLVIQLVYNVQKTQVSICFHYNTNGADQVIIVFSIGKEDGAWENMFWINFISWLSGETMQ